MFHPGRGSHIIAFLDDSSSTLGSKDSKQELRGVWICELSELDRVKGAALEKVKSFLTCRTDRYRESYGRRSGLYPRSCAFAATTNDIDYLCDPSGGRRFWPLKTGHIDLDALARDRDQLLAEALWLFRQGQPWWLTPAQEALAKVEQEARYSPGPWDEQIAEWIRPFDAHGNPVAHLIRRSVRNEWDAELPWFGSTPNQVNIDDVLIHCVGKNVADFKVGDQMAVGKYFRHLVWVRKQASSGPNRGKWYYNRPGPASPPPATPPPGRKP